jgi:hypothetical protein
MKTINGMSRETFIKDVIAKKEKGLEANALKISDRENWVARLTEGLQGLDGDEDEGLQFLRIQQKKIGRELDGLRLKRKLDNIEKQIFTSYNTKNGASLYPLFLSKFDETLAELYASMEERVREGDIAEAQYLKNCQTSLAHRNALREMCDELFPRELTEEEIDDLDPDAIVTGVICQLCNNVLPPHTVSEHFDLTCSIHECPHVANANA